MRLINSTKNWNRVPLDCKKLARASDCANPAESRAFNPDANLFVEKFQDVQPEYGWLWHSFDRDVNPFAIPRENVVMRGWDAFLLRKIMDLMGLTKRHKVNGLEFGYNSMVECINNRDRDSNLINMCSPLLHTYIHNWFDTCDKSGISWNIGTQSPNMTPIFVQKIVAGAMFVHTEDDLEGEDENNHMVGVRRNIFSTLNTSKIITEKGTLKFMNELLKDLDKGFFRIGIVIWVGISQFNERFVMTKDDGEILFDSGAVRDESLPDLTGQGMLPMSIVMPNRKFWKLHTTITMDPEKLDEYSWRIVDMNNLVGNHVATVNRAVKETTPEVWTPYFKAAANYATNANTWHELV